MKTHPQKYRPAVFLDRDGTIIEDCGHLSRPEQVVFFEDTIPALLQLQQHFDLFIVTNQSGVAKGIINTDDVARVNDHVLFHLTAFGVRIVETYVCPHAAADNCRCMKPGPYFLQQAAQSYFIDLPASYVIGDHPHDVKFAENAGATGIYVLSGHGMQHRAELPLEHTAIVPGILEAAQLICSQTLEANCCGPVA